MAGGAGDDIYFVDNGADVVNEAVGQGTDTVMASVSYALTAGSEIEFLRGTGTSGLSLNGNERANTVSGTSGDDTLDGGLGNDTLNGVTGNDFFKFLAGFGQDTIVAGFDFDPIGGQDLMDISDLGITAATFAANVTVANGGSGSTLVTIGAQLDPTPRRRLGQHHSVRLHSRLKSADRPLVHPGTSGRHLPRPTTTPRPTVLDILKARERWLRSKLSVPHVVCLTRMFLKEDGSTR